MADIPMRIGAEFDMHSGERVKITGIWPCGRGFQVTFRRVHPYDKGYGLRCSWTQFKRSVKQLAECGEGK